MRKDLNIELMRFVFMFLICVIHAAGYPTARWCHPLTNVSFLGVIGFVLLTPSVLSVYLIHCNEWGNAFFAKVDVLIQARGVPAILSAIALAAIVFVGGFLLDLPRRGIVCLCRMFVRRRPGSV